MSRYNFAIIGGGFFGMYVAEFLAKYNFKVCIIERNSELMQEASWVNQARIHQGYHYPRSILTGLRSRESFEKFNSEFKDCIDSSFNKYYAISKFQGKVTSNQFFRFCNYIGAPIKLASKSIHSLFNEDLISNVYTVNEYAFDSVKILKKMKKRLFLRKINIYKNSTVFNIKKNKDQFEIFFKKNSNEHKIISNQLINCTYSNLNEINKICNVATLPLKYELSEICLVKPPEILKNAGITIMDGPFFSIMPFPPKESLHSLSHVRYTPHLEWSEFDRRKKNINDQILNKYHKNTSFKKMIYDAKRFIPIMSSCDYVESLWTVKTILKKSENDDSRPILFNHNYQTNGYHCIMGGKIDNIYDGLTALKEKVLRIEK